MADRIIKSDSGNDVVIQNNGGTRKIEVTNSGDVEVTGDFKATTVKATNLKANDGSASLVVADSTGEVTSSGGLKATNIKTTNLKANDGTAGISIADSTGRLTVTETNPVIELGSNATFPSGHVLKTQMFDSSASITQESAGSYTSSAITSGSFSHGSGNKILIIAVCFMATTNQGWIIKVDGATSGPELEYYNSSNNSQLDTTTYAFLDSPSGTSTTYTVQFKRNSSGTATFYNVSSKLILMEIKG
jgi:hypothetical protein